MVTMLKNQKEEVMKERGMIPKTIGLPVILTLNEVKGNNQGGGKIQTRKE